MRHVNRLCAIKFTFLKKGICEIKKKLTFATALGEMAEWSIAVVLKTIEGNTSGGSNPSLSAKIKKA